MESVPKLSIVTPVYGSPQSLEELFNGIKSAAEELEMTFEVIMVDDRCPYNSWPKITELSNNHSEIVGIRLSRNFGQHPTIYAGLEQARGELIVVMDCDLQDRPSEIPNMVRVSLEGNDIVRARRVTRRDSAIRRWLSKRFYAILSAMTGVKHSAEIANFGVYSRKAIDTLLSWNESRRYFPADVQWIGFNTHDVEVEHGERQYGKSSYDIYKLADLAINIIISFSAKPLRIVATTGMLLSFLTVVASFSIVVVSLLSGFSVPGWATLVASIWFLSGLIIASIGMTGMYVSQILGEAKGRPNHIIDEKISG